jgi:hypothetical protein
MSRSSACRSVGGAIDASARGGQLDKRSHRVQAEQVKHAAHVLCNYLIAVANQHDARILMNDVGYLRQRRVDA